MVNSLNRLEANPAGMSAATAELVSRRLDLLLELRPGARLIGYLDNSRLSGAFDTNVENLTTAARNRGRELVVFDAATEHEVGTAFTDMALNRVRSLIVRPSSEIAKYQGVQVDPRQAGRDMSVSAVLSAGFLRGGNRIRVTAQLVDVASGDLLWSDRIDADATEPLVASLACSLVGQRREIRPVTGTRLAALTGVSDIYRTPDGTVWVGGAGLWKYAGIQCAHTLKA